MFPRMNCIPALALCCAALISLPLAAHASEPTPATKAPQKMAPAVSPMMAAIQAAVAEGRAKVSALQARLDVTTNDLEALALQRAIEQAKRDTELKILGIQATRARQEGRLEQATALEAAMVRLKTVGVTPAPSRPTPTAPARER